MGVAQGFLSSSIGCIGVECSEKGVKRVWIQRGSGPASEIKNSSSESQVLKKALKQLDEYFKGSRKVFDLPFDIEGTPFQKRVWAALLKIPYGKTCSYQNIAKEINNHKAVRAVGSANGKNPLCVIVPCHRVISADGSLGGYSGGLAIKKKLLHLEGIEYGL